MMKLKLILLITLFWSMSCARNSISFFDRAPASIANQGDLLELIESLGEAVEGGADSSLACAEGLNDYYQTLFKLRSNDIELSELTNESIKQTIHTSFQTRIEIGKKLGLLSIETPEDQACLDRVKDVMRALRYVEDYMIELLVEEKGDEKKYITLEGEQPYFLVNPKYIDSFKSAKDLRSGDIILSRGNAYSSAAIARIGTNDTQFSHLTFVYADKEGDLHTTEAHIEIGNVVAPLKKHIDQANARTVVFRYKNPAMAHKASQLIYKRVKKGVPGFFKNKNIKYDFGMDYRENDLLFCSEVVYAGFHMASDGEIEVPSHMTKFSRGMLPFLQTLGIAVNDENVDTFDTFGPGDIQFDSRFDLVAEWRNPNKLEDSRVKDLILTKIFHWMETEKYMFNSSRKINFKSGLFYGLRRTPLIRHAMKNKFPTNMTKAQLRMFLVLDIVGEIFYKVVKDEQVRREGPMTPIEIYSVLENYKRQDRARYDRHMHFKSELKKKRGKRDGKMSKSQIRKLIKQSTPQFHNWFHPKN